MGRIPIGSKVRLLTDEFESSGPLKDIGEWKGRVTGLPPGNWPQDTETLAVAIDEPTDEHLKGRWLFLGLRHVGTTFDDAVGTRPLGVAAYLLGPEAKSPTDSVGWSIASITIKKAR